MKLEKIAFIPLDLSASPKISANKAILLIRGRIQTKGKNTTVLSALGCSKKKNGNVFVRVFGKGTIFETKTRSNQEFLPFEAQIRRRLLDFDDLSQFTYFLCGFAAII